MRKMMSKEEIPIAEALVKREILNKGKSDDKQKNVAYFYNPENNRNL